MEANMSYCDELFHDFTFTIFIGNGTSKEDCYSIASQMLASEMRDKILLFDGIRLIKWGFEKKHICNPKLEDFQNRIETDGVFEIAVRSIDESLPKKFLLPILESHPNATISIGWKINDHYNDYENEGWTICDLDWADDSCHDEEDMIVVDD